MHPQMFNNDISIQNGQNRTFLFRGVSVCLCFAEIFPCSIQGMCTVTTVQDTFMRLCRCIIEIKAQANFDDSQVLITQVVM